MILNQICRHQLICMIHMTMIHMAMIDMGIAFSSMTLTTVGNISTSRIKKLTVIPSSLARSIARNMHCFILSKLGDAYYEISPNGINRRIVFPIGGACVACPQFKLPVHFSLWSCMSALEGVRSGQSV